MVKLDASGTALEYRECLGVEGKLELPQPGPAVDAVPVVEGDDCRVADESSTDRRVEHTPTALTLVGDGGSVTELVIGAEFPVHPSRAERADAGVPQSASGSTAGVEHVGNGVGRAVGEGPRWESVANEPVPTVMTGNDRVLVAVLEHAPPTTPHALAEWMGVERSLTGEPPVEE